MMPKMTFIVATMFVLAACQQAPVRDEASYLSRVGVGSTFVVNESLMVPVGRARVFLQGGRVVTKVGLDRYRPHCNFEVRSLSDGSLRIEPDTFLVTRVIVDEEEVVSRPQSLHYAALGLGGDMGGGGINMITHLVRHRLHSERQPEVMYLTCHGGFDYPFHARTPGIAEIRQVLGEMVTLNLVIN